MKNFASSNDFLTKKTRSYGDKVIRHMSKHLNIVLGHYCLNLLTPQLL